MCKDVRHALRDYIALGFYGALALAELTLYHYLIYRLARALVTCAHHYQT